jgi:hypothetical protein
MVTVSRQPSFPSWRRSLRRLSAPRLQQLQFRPVGSQSFVTPHADEEFGMIYSVSKATLPMGGGRI